MGERVGSRIILIGFSTTGKSAVGRELARKLGWAQVDTDDEVVRRTGKSIDQIFAQDGESHFRQIERQVLAEACEKGETVISAGGGAVLDPLNQALMKERGFVVYLNATPETIHRRLLEDREASGSIRPLLDVPDPLRRIRELKEKRRPHYDIADWTVHTDSLTLEEVGQEVLRGWYYWNRTHGREVAWARGDARFCQVMTATEHYPVIAGWGLLAGLGEEVKRSGLTGTAYVISDETVFGIYGGTATASLEAAGLRARCLTVAPGETTKSLDAARQVYDWLVGHQAERGDTVVSLGGGMIGDLAGFVAATFLRGLPVVHVPTSLVAMVDASIGGKTGVNHPRAKNVIGAFYQPRLVLADIQVLTTLPHRELVSGWAEVIKHGVILDAELYAFLEERTGDLAALEPEATTEAIGRSAAVKAAVVSEDEKERGRRTILNYGHTIAHGLETATNYERFLHGEAVAIGMTGAAMLSRSLGLVPWETVERQRALLDKFGLPTACSGVEPKAVLQAMELDKKVRKKAIRWVLLADLGRAVIRDDVPNEQVADTLDQLLGP